MSGILNTHSLAPPQPGRPGSTQSRELTARGKVVRAPADEASSVVVVVEGLSDSYGLTIPPGQWNPRGAALPSAGDVCLIVYDHTGDAWIPVWAPS